MRNNDYTFIAMKELVVPASCHGQRAEKFVRKYLPEAPLGFIYKTFRKKDVKVNGHWVKKDAILNEGDVLRIYVTDAQLEDFKKERPAVKRPFPYPIVYEDENVLIVDKPKGVLVYGDKTGVRETLGNAVLDYLYYKGEFDPNVPGFVPSPAHRLDRNTSGLVVYGKTDAGLKQLAELFKERDKIHKAYLALVLGDIKEDGKVDLPLWKDTEKGRVYVKSLQNGGKTALTLYHPVKRYGDYTLIEVELVTGRTHQIRVHMAAIKHPLVGDEKYGDFASCREVKAKTGLESQFLHAHKIRFDNIEGTLSSLSGKTFSSQLPEDLSTVIAILCARP